MSRSNSTPVKRCTVCRVEYPVTSEHFCRNRRIKDGWNYRCKLCCQTYQREHAAQIKAQRAQHHQEHRAEISAKAKARYAANPEPYKRRAKEWYRKNPERAKQQRKRYTEQHLESEKKRVREWGKAHPEVLKIANANRRAKMRELPRGFTKSDWRRALTYFGGCAVCGKQDGLAMAHWIPVSKGGGTTRNNIVPLCHGKGGCNSIQSNRLPQDVFSKEDVERVNQYLRSRAI